MEELLNKLIEKGWKPFGRNSNKAYYRPEGPDEFYFGKNGYGYIYNRRQIVSKESGLWQFVFQNDMVDGVDRWTLNARQKSIYDKYITSEKEYTPKMNYEYRLIESALKDESELEEFLLQNIKVEG